MFSGAIFDMDGVLVDNLKVHRAAFNEIARRYGVDFEQDTVDAMSGGGNREIFNAIFPRHVVETVGWQRLADEKEALYRELYARMLEPADGLVEFLNELKDNDVRLAVGTSAPRANMDFVLDGLDIRRYFDAVVNSDMVSRTKPDPEIYLTALKDLDLPAFECVVFEDAIFGIEAARRAGMKTIALATTVPKAKLQVEKGVVLVINNFTEINYAAVKALL